MCWKKVQGRISSDSSNDIQANNNHKTCIFITLSFIHTYLNNRAQTQTSGHILKKHHPEVL